VVKKAVFFNVKAVDMYNRECDTNVQVLFTCSGTMSDVSLQLSCAKNVPNTVNELWQG